MVLVIFRLNKETGVSTTFTLGKNYDFNKLILKAVEIEKPNGIEPNGGNAPTEGPLPVYLDSSLFTNNSVVFYQGRNNTIPQDIDHLIPIGAVGTAGFYRELNLTIIDGVKTSLLATDTVTFALKQIQENVAANLVAGQIFGGDDNSSGNASDHGVNLYFEFVTDNSHDVDQTYSLADSS